MPPISHLGITRTELLDRVDEECWRRWSAMEPKLRRVRCFDDIQSLRGGEADDALGALLRIAGCQGGNDEVAAAACCHQVASLLRRVALATRARGEDIDHLVLAAAWIAIRSYAWSENNSGHAIRLMFETRRLVNSWLHPTFDRHWVNHEHLIDPLENGHLLDREPGSPWVNAQVESWSELRDVLEWAAAERVISSDDVLLLIDLIEAEDLMPRQSLRPGICAMEAAELVASRRGVCAKTVTRNRDRIVGALRRHAADYLETVA